MKSQPAKRAFVGELQVRTIFEEGWSEIDHRVRYPRLSDDPYLAQFLTIFNRLAGSSDEMGTFVRGLSDLIHQHALKVTEKEDQMAQMEAQLRATISKLEISEKDKENLENQIGELRKRSQQSPDIKLGDEGSRTWHFGTHSPVSSYPKLATTISSFTAAHSLFTKKQTCSKCGKEFEESALTMTVLNRGQCPDCRKSNPFGLYH